MKYDNKQVGERIKSIRHSMKMTQAVLAEKTELHDTFISRIETGKRRASINSLVKIKSVLNTSLDYIVLGEKN